MKAAGGSVIAIGKISDIYAGCGVTQSGDRLTYRIVDVNPAAARRILEVLKNRIAEDDVFDRRFDQRPPKEGPSMHKMIDPAVASALLVTHEHCAGRYFR